ncbi:MAG: thiazole synthase [Planctomycetes bacterium]|nr:thiazole synthase [Planctomycetota bacterium]
MTAPAADAASPDLADTPLVVGRHSFRSRLLLGTGKYPSHEVMRAAHLAAGTECVTVAVRRVDLTGREKSLLDWIDRSRITLLPNTAGCFDADDAVRVARLGREAGLSELVKLEVLADPRTLLPDPIATLDATRRLVKEGFVVLPYCSDDPVLCRRLEEAGAAAVMPLGSPIGSGQGINNPRNIRAIKQALRVPVLVDAGVGTPSDVTVAFELGVDGVLLNTAVAQAREPARMAAAMRHAWIAGRQGFLAGRIAVADHATPSSPESGRIAAASG